MTYSRELTPAEKGAATKAIRAKTAQRQKVEKFDKLFTMGSPTELEEEMPVGLTIGAFKTIEDNGLKVTMRKVKATKLHKGGEIVEDSDSLKIGAYDKEASYLYEDKTEEEMAALFADPDMQTVHGGIGLYSEEGRENLKAAKKKLSEKRRAQLAARS